MDKAEPSHLVAHLHFFPNAQSQAKKCKRATRPTHQDSASSTACKTQTMKH